jgi:hypothetical protein
MATNGASSVSEVTATMDDRFTAAPALGGVGPISKQTASLRRSLFNVRNTKLPEVD